MTMIEIAGGIILAVIVLVVLRYVSAFLGALWYKLTDPRR